MARLFASASFFAIAPAALILADARPAAAIDACSGYQNCSNKLQQQHIEACNEQKREDRNYKCPPLTSQMISRICGAAPNCAPVTGTVRPKLIVTSVIYAPPGSSKAAGSVDYGSSSTAGVSTSAGSSFKTDVSVTATMSLGTKTSAASGELSESVGDSSTSGSSSSLDIKTTSSTDTVVNGASTDGIDHNLDTIYFLLDPTVAVSATGDDVAWQVGADQQTRLQFVQVGWLKHPTPAQSQMFAAWGLSSADLATLLGRDPLAWYPGRGPGAQQSMPMGALDPKRFTLTSFQCPYEGVSNTYSCNRTISNDSMSSTSSTSQDQYSVTESATGGYGFLDWFKESLKIEGSWTWTDNTSTGYSQDWKQTASVKIANPSSSWAGPYYNFQVYFDSMYRTFLFMPSGVGTPPTVTGVAYADNGQPAAGTEVVVNANGRVVRTVTNAKGVYKAYDLPSGPARVTYGERTQSTMLGRGTATVNFTAAPLPRTLHR